jgi:hypothetical protein
LLVLLRVVLLFPHRWKASLVSELMTMFLSFMMAVTGWSFHHSISIFLLLLVVVVVLVAVVVVVLAVVELQRVVLVGA